MKKVIALVISILFLIPPLFYLMQYSHSQDITLFDQKVIYELPYPGILPDNPLYIAKQMRDIIIELTTRDYLKKADFLLLQSDKKTQMALLLSKKGKTKLAIDTLNSAEKTALRIPGLLKESKKQGIDSHESFTYTLKLSNTKHREVIETLMKETPRGKEEEIRSILDINTEVKKQLDTL